MAFAGVALSACLSGVYLLRSACVIGECAPIQRAQQLKRWKAEVQNPTATIDRTTIEKFSAKAYNQAVSHANLAKRYEQQNQLAMAVTNWSQALTYAKLVPTSTFYHSKVKPLINSYSSALKQAQANLRVANVFQKARTDLNRTCSSHLRVCNYSMNSQGIIVQLTSDYERALKRGFITASFQGDSNPQTGVVNQYKTLGQALEAISDNTSLPLKLYDAKGSLIHAYSPST